MTFNTKQLNNSCINWRYVYEKEPSSEKPSN